MFGIHDFLVFLSVGILLNLTPGPDTLYIVGRSLAHGRAAGIASALGIGTGALLHTLAAAVGLSAILAASSAAFITIKFVGAAYLVFLGVRILFDRGSSFVAQQDFAKTGALAVYKQGIVTNILNPKVALFFLAFLPQFIDPTSSQKLLAFMTLGLTFVGTGTVWCVCVALLASYLWAKLNKSPRMATALNNSVGIVFVALGVRLAFTD